METLVIFGIYSECLPFYSQLLDCLIGKKRDFVFVCCWNLELEDKNTERRRHRIVDKPQKGEIYCISFFLHDYKRP